MPVYPRPRTRRAHTTTQDWEVHGGDGAVSDGSRRGPQVKGAVQLKDYVGTCARPDGASASARCTSRAWLLGAFTSDDALCLLTMTPGEVGEDAHLALTPPHVRLCYGELHGEQDSLRILRACPRSTENPV